MEYFEQSMIFYPEIKIFIRFSESDGMWRGKVPAFRDISIKSPNLNDVILQIGTILNDNIEVIMNTEKRAFIKEIRFSDMVIEYWGERFFYIYKTRKTNIYNIISLATTRDNTKLFLHKIIDENVVKELLSLCTKITLVPPDGDGFDGALYSLKIKTGVLNNYSSICWWSGSDGDWFGLTDVINKLNEIYDMNFLPLSVF